TAVHKSQNVRIRWIDRPPIDHRERIAHCARRIESSQTERASGHRSSAEPRDPNHFWGLYRKTRETYRQETNLTEFSRFSIGAELLLPRRPWKVCGRYRTFPTGLNEKQSNFHRVTKAAYRRRSNRK